MRFYFPSFLGGRTVRTPVGVLERVETCSWFVTPPDSHFNLVATVQYHGGRSRLAAHHIIDILTWNSFALLFGEGQ